MDSRYLFPDTPWAKHFMMNTSKLEVIISVQKVALTKHTILLTSKAFIKYAGYLVMDIGTVFT